MRHLVLIICILAMSVPALHCQDKDGMIMHYFVDESGDTIFMADLDPVYKVARRKGKQWRKYYRLVHNFAKAYPYALLAEEKLHEADSTITAGAFNRREKNRYINILQKELFDTFEKPLKNLTISQGKLLLRLIDRQTGITSYEIIKDYKGKAAAGFWQGIARIFGSDMKKPYDPQGEDKQTEELVELYNKGEFNKTYRSIFGKNPPEPIVHSRLEVRQK
ncbi:MAG TPA: DUF4294 domain-containing protein [Candidatus Coprenecus stercoravium]|uniref:DUF4294 domain-containing protein n=1 Tax=Candidatus Coprenecus stercoravium TaxID=2840735 RepID=A0A9D2GQW7_9BACT|nr:DUF4294 domain-containing protein [Candidatus Coprenecus stercoravium]